MNSYNSISKTFNNKFMLCIYTYICAHIFIYFNKQSLYETANGSTPDMSMNLMLSPRTKTVYATPYAIKHLAMRWGGQVNWTVKEHVFVVVQVFTTIFKVSRYIVRLLHVLLTQLPSQIPYHNISFRFMPGFRFSFGAK